MKAKNVKIDIANIDNDVQLIRKIKKLIHPIKFEILRCILKLGSIRIAQINEILKSKYVSPIISIHIRDLRLVNYLLQIREESHFLFQIEKESLLEMLVFLKSNLDKLSFQVVEFGDDTFENDEEGKYEPETHYFNIDYTKSDLQTDINDLITSLIR